MIQYKMQLTLDEEAILREETGETLKKVLETSYPIIWKNPDSKRIDSLAAAGVITAQIWNNRNNEIYVLDELGEKFIQTVKTRDRLKITKKSEVVRHPAKP